VDEQMREVMIVAFDNAVRMVGAQSFEEGMRQAKTVLENVSSWALFANNFIQPIETVQDLRETLDSRMSIPEREQALLLFALENLPEILREGVTTLKKKVVSSLGPRPGGRKRAFTAQESQEVLDYVSKVNREGASMPAAKRRAAQKYHCSPRTVDRLWKNREFIAKEEPPTIQELISMVLKAGEADGWRVPA